MSSKSKLRKPLAILVVVGGLFQALGGLVLHLNFAINRNFIAKNLCIEKENIENECRGACCLKKKIEEIQRNEQSQSPVNSKSETVLLYCQDINELAHLGPHLRNLPLVNITPKDQVVDDQHSANSVFRPPIFA